MEGNPGTLTQRRALALGVALLASSLPAFAAPAVGSGMAALAREVDPAAPYLSFAEPGLLYALMPLAVLGACALVLSPGLLLALALGKSRGWATWTLHGFALSGFVVSLAAAAVQTVAGEPLTGGAFVLTTLGCTAAAGGVLALRLRSGNAGPWPLATRGDRVGLAAFVAVPLLLLVALTPKLFWEAFNGDGAHTFEATRLLLHQAVPFWEAGSGQVSNYPGMNTAAFLYPISWFMRLFGEHESAVRLPFLLYLGVLHAAVTAAASAGRDRRLGPVEIALTWAGLVTYALVMSYSATYDPYCADVALPATQDTILVACFLGTVHAFATRSRAWLGVWVLLTLTISPAGALMLAAFGGGLVISRRGVPWRDLVALAATGAVAFALMSAVAPFLLRTTGLPSPGGEHDAASLMSKFRYVLPLDVARVAFVVLPCGIFPVLGLLAWRSADASARALILTALGVFAMYYGMAFVSLHYFVPAMVIPLVVFWRTRDGAAWERLRPAHAAYGALAVCALALSLPSSSAIHTASRTVGERIDVSAIDGYERMAPDAFLAADALTALFPTDAAPDVPARAYGGSPLAWHHYARSAPPDAEKAYVLQPLDAPPPTESELVGSNEVAAVYVRDRQRWDTDRTAHPLGSQGAAAYDISRDVLFGRAAAAGEQYWIIDTLWHLKRWSGAER